MNKKTLIFIISSNNIEYIKNSILKIDNMENTDLLIIDEGSDYNIIEEVKGYKSVKIINYNQPTGYGSYLYSARQYAIDFDYDYLISIDCNTPKALLDAENIIYNLEYGYDIVTCSRILENYNHSKIEESTFDFFEKLNEYLNGVTKSTITDPLSTNFGLNIKSTNQLNLTESNHSVLLQVFIQSHFFGYNIIEVPSESELNFGEEIKFYEEPLSEFTSIIETESYLYNKGTIN